MGVDLTLVPVKHDVDEILAYDRLRTDRDRDLHYRIRETCDPRPLRREIQWYDDDGISDVARDPYDEPLTYCHADRLAAVFRGQASPWNQAVGAFLAALPPDTRVILWWC